MIGKVEAYIAECDGCGVNFEDGNFGIFIDEGYISEAMQETEWHICPTPDKKCYCPACHHFNDEDELIIKPKK